MKRISRNRKLTPAEAEKYKAIREKVDAELPQLTADHAERMTFDAELEEFLEQHRQGKAPAALNVKIRADFRHNFVVMQLSEPAKWVAMPAEQALELGRMLVERACEIAAQRPSEKDGDDGSRPTTT